MTELDQRTFRAMGRAMAEKNGYTAKQSSAMYRTEGDQIDWMYARQRIFSFTFELYPRSGTARQRHYPPDEVIPKQTRRNRAAVLYLMAKAGCPYEVLSAMSARLNCGPFFDDLEVWRGWRTDPGGGDTASDGRWVRGDAMPDRLQLGSAVSGRAVLVTGRRAGHDVDGGRTRVRSPLIDIPASGRATVRLRYWLGHSATAGPEDGLRVVLVDADGTPVATLAEIMGAGTRREPRWRSLERAVPEELAGRRLSIQLVAIDEGPDSTVEAGVDQVRITTD
jgi:hypothetical protein